MLFCCSKVYIYIYIYEFSAPLLAIIVCYYVYSIAQVHINVLVLEARLQAELIYALRAIMTYMKAT